MNYIQQESRLKKKSPLVKASDNIVARELRMGIKLRRSQFATPNSDTVTYHYIHWSYTVTYHYIHWSYNRNFGMRGKAQYQIGNHYTLRDERRVKAQILAVRNTVGSAKGCTFSGLMSLRIVTQKRIVPWLLPSSDLASPIKCFLKATNVSMEGENPKT